MNTRTALLSLGPPARSSALAKVPRSQIIWRTLLIFSASLSWAQGPRPTVPQVEAAYLYNFGKFVTWPPDRTTDADQFRICVLGKDPFGSVLDSTVTGERIGGRQIERIDQHRAKRKGDGAKKHHVALRTDCAS